MKHIENTIRVIFWLCGALAFYGYGALLFKAPSLEKAGLVIIFVVLTAIFMYIMPFYCIASVLDFVQIKPTRGQKISVVIWSTFVATICFAVALNMPIDNQYYERVAIASSAALVVFLGVLHFLTLCAHDLMTVKRDMEILRRETLKKSGFWHLP